MQSENSKTNEVIPAVLLAKIEAAGIPKFLTFSFGFFASVIRGT